MSILELLFISIGLAMDCFAVSFSAGATQKDLKLKNILIIAFSFGLFQGGMPVLGWLGGEMVVEHICHIDHWIAFGILTFIGGKMLFDGIRPDREEKKTNFSHPITLLILSIATSIDALAVGFSFSILHDVNIIFSALVIGITSFLLSIVGVYTSRKISHFIKPQYAEIFGGIILMAIGTKILITHLIV